MPTNSNEFVFIIGRISSQFALKNSLKEITKYLLLNLIYPGATPELVWADYGER